MILGDCLEELKKLKDHSVDHCITDPPYNISGYDNKKKIGWYESNETWKKDKSFTKIDENWDNYSDDEFMEFSFAWLNEIKRVVKPNGNILIFGTYHSIYKIGYMLEKINCKINNSIIWYKRNAFPNITQRMLCESTEQIIWAVNNDRKKATKWIFNYKEMKNYHPEKKQLRNMWDIPMTKSSEKSFGKHPTQKPLEIADRLIVGFTLENQIILDPFAGSGTFLLAAKIHKRSFVGIEKDENYFKIARKRLGYKS